MKFTPHLCPKCNEPAIATKEHVVAWAMLEEPDEDGETEYTGETDHEYDGQETVKDEKGRVTLKCDNGHQWQSAADHE